MSVFFNSITRKRYGLKFVPYISPCYTHFSRKVPSPISARRPPLQGIEKQTWTSPPLVRCSTTTSLRRVYVTASTCMTITRSFRPKCRLTELNILTRKIHKIHYTNRQGALRAEVRRILSPDVGWAPSRGSYRPRESKVRLHVQGRVCT